MWQMHTGLPTWNRRSGELSLHSTRAGTEKQRETSRKRIRCSTVGKKELPFCQLSHRYRQLRPVPRMQFPILLSQGNQANFPPAKRKSRNWHCVRLLWQTSCRAWIVAAGFHTSTGTAPDGTRDQAAGDALSQLLPFFKTSAAHLRGQHL